MHVTVQGSGMTIEPDSWSLDLRHRLCEGVGTCEHMETELWAPPPPTFPLQSLSLRFLVKHKL